MKASLVLLGKSLQILPWLYNLPNLSLLVWLPLGWPSLPNGKRLLPSKSSHYRQFQYLLLLLHPTCIILVLYILYTFSLKNGTIVYKHHHTCFPIDARALLFHHAKDAIRSSFVIYFRDHVTQWHRVHFLSRSIPTAFWTYIDIGEEWSDWLEGVKRGSNNNIEVKGLKNAFFIYYNDCILLKHAGHYRQVYQAWYCGCVMETERGQLTCPYTMWWYTRSYSSYVKHFLITHKTLIHEY